MAIPKFPEEFVQKAIQYIDENGVPEQNRSTKYELIMEDGKKYPPKYVIAVAAKLATGKEVQFNDFNAVEAKGYFETRGYMIDIKQEKFEMTITEESVVSTDDRFTMDNLSLGDNYKPIDAYFQPADGDVVRRKRNKSENRISNQTLPRLACQIFENQLNSLSVADKESFPICQYTPKNEVIRGIYPSEPEYKKHRNTMEMMVYKRENGPQFVMYSWNVFSTLVFVRECLKRFGNPGDKFVFVYRDKTDQEKNQTTTEKVVTDDVNKTTQESKNPYSRILLESKNIIFRGAPGTGKSYLAKEIAADIISNGYTDQYADLTPEQKEQIEFVQFHPSYDYSDFVEGLRPKLNDDGSMGFELQDGVFKRFVSKARKNYEDSLKSKETVEQEMSILEAMNEFFSEAVGSEDPLTTTNGSEFYIIGINEGRIDISIPKNDSVNSIKINVEEIKRMLESDITFEKNSDITRFLGIEYTQQRFSYDLAIYREIMKIKAKGTKSVVKMQELKKYIFIIDEINVHGKS